MNARDGLERIRERLVVNGARPETLRLVDTMIDRASAPGADRAQASLAQLARLLMRTPAANGNVGVYDDLARIEYEFQTVAAQRAAEAEAEANKPIPKSKKYYKQLKDKQKAQG